MSPLPEILSLSQSLIRIPSITVGAEERVEEVWQAARLITDYLDANHVPFRCFDDAKYPAILAGFPGQLTAPVMLSGHFDVVAPEPDDSQFDARIEGDYLWGRGSADMKTVVATNLVWLKEAIRRGPPYPLVNLLLVGNEENGEEEPMGTPYVLKRLQEESGYQPDIFIAGERTEETGHNLWGTVCVENRGVGRFQVVARGTRIHSAASTVQNDLTERIIRARMKLSELAAQYMTLESKDIWKSQIRFPFVNIGTPGVYNITPNVGLLGVEIRSIPHDDIYGMMKAFDVYCQENEIVVEDLLLEHGIACDPNSPWLAKLIESVSEVSGQPASVGKKIHGTSARFAPGGNGVVWGQSGLGPHARDERHYIPSIEPYFQALDAFGKKTIEN
ncbi:MAG: M20 family metallopeptidase [Anaerolineales bacterium]|nr:M20 family metallopeptidase [Anaerolineales bacterium]